MMMGECEEQGDQPEAMLKERESQLLQARHLLQSDLLRLEAGRLSLRCGE